MYNLGEAVGYIRLEMGKFLQEAQQAQTATKDIENEFDKLGNTAKSVEGIIVKSFAAIGAAVVAGLGQAVNVGSQFEASMSQVAATMGMTAEDIASGSGDFEKLSAAAMEMGETTKYSASQAADALNYLALAGYNTEQAISTLPTVLNLASAGGMDLARASDMITDAASALGLQLDEMSLFADKMAKAAQSSNTSVEQLGNAILQIGGTARNMAGGVTELNTALGILANNGIKSAEGGTALRQIMLNLTAPTEKAAKYIEELGLQVADAAGNVRPLNEIFRDLDEILQSKGITGSADKIKALSQIFDARQLKSATALLNNYGEQWDRLYEKIDNAEGAASTMADTMNTNLKGALTILGSTAEGFGITVYNSIEESFKNAVNEATKQLSTLNNAFKSTEMQQSLEKISDAISKAIVKLSEFISDIIPKLTKGLSDVIDNFDKISGIIAGLTTTIGLAAVGMSLYKIQTDLVTQSLIAQKLAQLAVNAAMLANPYTIVAVSVGVLVGALVSLEAQQKAEFEQIDKINSKYYEMQDTVSDAVNAYDEEIQKAKELENSRDEEISQVDELLSIIKMNVDETGKIISNTEMVKGAIDELNSILPVNIQYQKDQIINYDDLVIGSQKYCEQLKLQAIVEANVEKYKSAATAYDEAAKKQDELTKNLEEAQSRFEKVRQAKEEYGADISEFQAEADAMGIFVGDYIADLYDSAEEAYAVAAKAWNDNKALMAQAESDMIDAQQSMNHANVEMLRASNELLGQQVKNGQEVTGMFRSESEARIGIAEYEAQRIAEISREEAQNRLNNIQGGNDEIITAEEDLEAALEELEIQYNTGVISTDKEYHERRLELLENFHGEWTKKTSQWLKQEIDYQQTTYDNEIKEEERRRKEQERLRQQEIRDAEAAEREKERLYKEETNKKIEEIDRRKKRDESYTDEQYLADLTALRDTIDKKNELWQQLDDKIFDYQKQVTENNKRELEQQEKDTFESYKRRKSYDENYTTQKYLDDLTAFSETLDKESDIYKSVMDEMASARKELSKELEEADKKSFQAIKDKYEIEKNKGYTLEQYLADLKNYLDTLDKASDLYVDVQKEITRTEEKIASEAEKAAKEEQDRIDKNNKKYLDGLKNRVDIDEKYTKEMYLKDLQTFANTLNKESDMYQTVLKEIASVNKQIATENQNNSNKAFQTWEKGFDALKSEAEKSYNEIINKQKALEETLNKQIDLFDVRTKRVKNLATGLWEDVEVKKTSTKYLQDQLNELESYQKSLEMLSEKGISDELMAEILGMDEESAKEYVKTLNSMSDDSLKAYDETYQKLKVKNKEFAEKYYADEVETFKTEWGNKIQAYIETLPEDARAAAKTIIEEFINGLNDTDFDTDNNVFNQLFSSMLGDFSERIESGDMFENYGVNSINNLTQEIDDNSNTLTSECNELGISAGQSLANGMESMTAVIGEKAVEWVSTIKNTVKQQLNNLGLNLDSLFNYNIPYNTFENNVAPQNNVIQTAQPQQTLTKEDVKEAIQEALPSGNVYLNVDGNNFAHVARNTLNFLAQQTGNLGLQV